MSDLSYADALAELDALLARGAASPPTVVELRDIVARTRVTLMDAANPDLELK